MTRTCQQGARPDGPQTRVGRAEGRVAAEDDSGGVRAVSRPSTRVWDASALSEKAFQRNVVALARLWKWWTYHNPDSRRSAAGLPDLILCKPPRLIFAELKAQRGRLRPSQTTLLEALAGCGVECYVWRPSDWGTVVETLLDARAPGGRGGE